MHAVSWLQVHEYAAWAGVMLPSEAQWERAARGGHDDFLYPWGEKDDVLHRNASGSDDGYATLAPVKSYAPNDFGLYDMSGNVVEWCQDTWHASYDGAPSTESAWETPSDEHRVTRGGSWGSGEKIDSKKEASFLLRASCRYWVPSAWAVDCLGFRCVRITRDP
jgi:sulfatase modifying factor 1